MKQFNLKDFYRGWYVGNFEPNCYKTDQFEVGLLEHRKGEVWPAHIHKIATEINLLIEGKMIINGKEISTGENFIIEPNEVADPEFLTDCKLVVIKTPSIPTDKYNV